MQIHQAGNINHLKQIIRKILITGGTGTVGKSLVKHLTNEGHTVVLLTRKSTLPADQKNILYRHWDPETPYTDADLLSGVDTIINLAGSGVMDKRWTEAYKTEILKSRVRAAECLTEGLKKYPHQVNTWINASAIGWYGPDKQDGKAFIETDPHYPDYLGETCLAWESSTKEVESMGIRVVKLRIGIVLSTFGGALKEFLTPLKFRVASILGNGNQKISWIHVDDLCNMILFMLSQTELNGIFNAVSPNPVSNRALMLALARYKFDHRFIPMHVPAFLLNIILGESSIEVLKSTTVSAAKISGTGYHYLYPTLEEAIPSLINPSV